MTQLTVLIWAISLVAPAMATAQQAVRRSAAKAPTAMTNADIMKMARAGFSDELIISTIRAAKKTAFTTTPDALIELKGQGVSNAVISVVLDPSASVPAPQPAASAAPKPPDPNDPLAPHPLGLYIDEGSGAPRLALVQPSAFEAVKTGGAKGTALTGLTLGFKKMKSKAVVRSPRAELRTRNPQQPFYAYFDQSNAFGASGGLSSPSELVLVRLKPKEDCREVTVGKIGGTGVDVGISKEDRVDFTAVQLAPGIYRIKPNETLEQGEYGFVVVTAGGAQGPGKLFAFGVDG